MYIRFKNLRDILPEKRNTIVFSNPDLYITFMPTRRFVIWESVLSDLDKKWLEGVALWPTEFDFGTHEEDYTRQFDDYKTIELLQFPKLDDLNVEEDFAFVFDDSNELYISEKFVHDLKSAGCVDIWYDTTAPHSRY
ncbi:hypothetical protein B6A42_05955 [Vibrio coralliilyticus]|uniref:hypothetical protein n=1 Tax=Vibrio coralliilyticus TaxID=190893 RepID=UPI0009C3BCE1|nr:hypothetical protein [Vibrio coralliilyticus]ARC91742.1 hypothetical protein B6A42_05955 [Vibrio coralliilyticus]NUW66834.1 hypothetical protein [Vibrio coralliilyticus]